eukprot:6208417-Pleurochrysis_carterae.AAC.1
MGWRKEKAKVGQEVVLEVGQEVELESTDESAKLCSLPPVLQRVEWASGGQPLLQRSLRYTLESGLASWRGGSPRPSEPRYRNLTSTFNSKGQKAVADFVYSDQVSICVSLATSAPSTTCPSPCLAPSSPA